MEVRVRSAAQSEGRSPMPDVYNSPSRVVGQSKLLDLAFCVELSNTLQSVFYRSVDAWAVHVQQVSKLHSNL